MGGKVPVQSEQEEAPRGIYQHADLARIFNPQSVAIVGVSPNRNSFAGKTLANMATYKGRLYLINARYEALDGRRCYPSVSSLPESPDCVLIAVGREAVAEIVADCAARKAGGVIIYASGYSETGKAEWMERQQALTSIARDCGMPIVGPNCLGTFNFSSNAIMSFVNALSPTAVRAPAIGLVSQSGALSLSLGEAQHTGISISHILLTGNSCDVDVADGISFLAQDPQCQAIACVFEGMPRPLRLLQAGEIARKAGKPVVVCKLATGEMGAVAAMSHTGSLAGSSAAYRALFERAGMILVDNFEALIETAAFFAKAPRLKARGVAAISASGGAAIMAADKAEIHGVPMPQPDEATRRTLERLIPEFGSPRNPCDATAQVATDPQMQEACIQALLDDPTYGTLVQVMGSSGGNTDRLVKLFGRLGRQQDKLICIVWNSAWHDSPCTLELELDPKVALFRSMDRCFQSLAAWHRREEALAGAPRRLARLVPADAVATATALIAQSPNRMLTEREAKAVLSLYGIPVVGERLTQDAAGAVAAAQALGYPVALKVESPDIPHKTEAGVVRLNLKNEAEVRAACDAIMANARLASSGARINGVLVQPMAPSGTEIMVGGRVDPQFGPLLVVGLGGILVELLKDIALELAPVTQGEALAMLARLKGSRVLEGFRGAAAVDLSRLAELIVRLSEFAADQQAHIEEFDVNPLICGGTSIVAVDALIVKRVKP